jgi:hypothetical protein
MRKKSVVVFILLLLCATYIYIKYVHGWLQFRRNSDTPEKFLCHNVIDKTSYSKDSIHIWRGLKEQLSKHDEFFHTPAFFDSTEIIIDTIVYNPTFDKLAILLITKNPTYRNDGLEKYQWYYDATCYLGIRKNNDVELSWIGPNFTNSTDKQNIANNVRTEAFRMFATRDSTDGRRYNINDARFWTSSIWKEIEDKRLRKKEFIEEKQMHPENVYEPPKK